MVTRRRLVSSMVIGSLVQPATLFAKGGRYFGVPDVDLQYPPLPEHGEGILGVNPATADEEEAAAEILSRAPTGSTAFEVANYFVSGQVPAKYLDQWPHTSSWNPLIVDFFTVAVTDVNVKNDLVPWCAAFARWCLYRVIGDAALGSASSQSFMKQGLAETAAPEIGDIAVFTAYRQDNGADTGLGHVGFVASKPSGDEFEVLGGNQSKTGDYSCICVSGFKKNNPMTRCLSVYKNGVCSKSRVNVNLRINKFFKAPEKRNP
ncbi:CHAP domain [Burkholderia pseudomallei]|uniref:CHAP domain-containing protein n=1 Tax=Burkholderia pseudomallei TaxID=28450 RepID=UPI000F1DD23A|nr:CHAP domain-containing protein [Burkholderia pseudomallei]CAJ3150252.1 CHAP domain [Burkholderia pseudomallei]VCN38284.1 CHAP domain [Burkholderia pseudomallei]VCN49632.1 CHAP domain [Burkholderia pseudomallei]VCN64710.1 CHAP domain [Burkholderia pseudomallei]VCN69651.1 CHAP domain [Burkholderia pseudomallei]